MIVGAGPNGLAAAVVLAREGRRVLVLEARDQIGGSCRTDAGTLPGFLHDVCSTVYPLAAGSPLFRALPLARHGLAWVQPPLPLAHPLDGQPAVLLHASVEETAAGLGADAAAYRALVEPLSRRWHDLAPALLGPPAGFARHPLALAGFGLHAIRSLRGLADSRLRTPAGRALLAGLAAHSMLPLSRAPSAAFALLLGAAAHAVGWPFARGGAQRIVEALAGHLEELGGEVVTGAPVHSLDELPAARLRLLDLTPRQVLRLAGDRLPRRYRARLAAYRYGPGVFKIDWALDGPIPWRDEACGLAGTVHLGGSLEEIAASEAAVWDGRHPDRPFVILAQPSLFDRGRCPPGKQVAWGYCHVPSGSREEMTARIEGQLERFAPGFARRVLARRTLSAAALEEHNPNCVGGDINGGAQDLRQTLARPALRLSPYATPLPGLLLCSSSTPPGGGVHGMCGYHAALAALRREE